MFRLPPGRIKFAARHRLSHKHNDQCIPGIRIRDGSVWLVQGFPMRTRGKIVLEIAFAVEEKQNAAGKSLFAVEEKQNAAGKSLFAVEEKQNAAGEIAFGGEEQQDRARKSPSARDKKPVRRP